MRTGLKLLRQSVDLARRLDDPDTLWASGSNLLSFQLAPQHAADSVRLSEEILSSSRIGVKLYTIAGVLFWAGNHFLVMGKRQRAETVWDELRDSTTRTGQPTLEIQSSALDGTRALIDGRLEEVLRIASSVKTHGAEVGVSGMANILALISEIRAKVYLYKELEVLESTLRTAVGDIERSELRVATSFSLILAHLGRKDDVVKILEWFVVRRPNIGTHEDLMFTYLDTLFLEAAVLVGHRQVVELLLKRFVGTGVVTSGIFQPTCILRHLGAACKLLGRYEEARKYYDEAIKVCIDMKFRPELALSRLQLAELLLEHYPNEKKEAVEHLDFCIKEFREMKMQPSLERSLRHKEILKT
jgi:tetratricopeptide (TPR) repeat protein